MCPNIQRGGVWWLFALALLAFFGCQPDDRNYEAEIVSIHFVRPVGSDTMLLVSDTIRPTSTSIDFNVSFKAELDRLVPVLKLSNGATANITSGRAYDFSKPFIVSVTSENERYTRHYTFRASRLDAPPIAVPTELSSEAQLGDFRLDGVDGEVTMRGTRITVVVPDGTDISGIGVLFTLSAGATCDYEQGTKHDFADPLYIRVTAEDGASVVTYRIAVHYPEKALSPDAQILKFRFGESRRPVYIEGARIYAEVEPGIDLRELTPIFTLSPGATSSLPLGEYADFSGEVKMEVISEDKSSKSIYTIYTSQFKRSEVAIDSVRIPGLGDYTFSDAQGYTYVVGHGVDITHLKPKVYVSKGCRTDLDQQREYDLSTPLVVTVTSEDGMRSKRLTLTVRKVEGGEPGEKGRLLTFGFENSTSSSVIRGNEVHVSVPRGTDLTKLIPTYTVMENPLWEKLGYTPGALYYPGSDGRKIESGQTEVDFSQSPVKLEVWRKWLATWAGADVGRYSFYVTHEAAPTEGAKLRELSFAGVDIALTFRGNAITGVAPVDADLTALRPTLKLSEGATATMESGKAYDFSTMRTIVVTSRDGLMSQRYTVLIEKRLNDQAQLVEFRLEELPNSPTVAGNLVTFFAGSECDVSKLTPRFTLSRGATANLEQGVVQDFSKPVRMVVTSEDRNISRTYTIAVEQRLNYEADIVSFRFLELEEPCRIDGTRIIFSAKDRDVTRLTPVFTLSPGATANVQSGVPQDFSQPVRIRVTSEDKSNNKTYTVRQEQVGLLFDFERWQSFEGGAYEHPNGGWSSCNVGMVVSKKFTGKPNRYPVRKSSDAHGGRYAAEISTEELGVQGRSIASGALFLGSFNGAVVMSDELSAPQFGIAWGGGQPANFSGWYKYKAGGQMVDKAGSPIAGEDRPAIYAIFYYGETLTAKDVHGSDRIISIARVTEMQNGGDWTRFDIPFEPKRDVPAGQQLKYSIVLSSSTDGDRFHGAVGSTLLVDDLEITLK